MMSDASTIVAESGEAASAGAVVAPSLLALLREDYRAHGRDWTKPGFRAIAAYRVGVWRMSIRSKILRAPFSIVYRAMFRHVRNHYGIELPYSASVGRRVVIEHQSGIVIHGNCVIGDDCIIRQGVTLGNRVVEKPLEAPVLGRGVNVGAGEDSGGCADWGWCVDWGECGGAGGCSGGGVGGGDSCAGDSFASGRWRMSSIGVVIIGRNEGARLAACIESIQKSAEVGVVDIVYVDSNSSDQSVELAGGKGAHVVVLDPALPFTAARARNAGAEALLARHPDVTYLQFVDGDTEVGATWLKHACGYLDHHPAIAVVCGRRRERFPEASIYNLLADMEWDTAIGVATEFGGDAMIRAAAFRALGGYSSEFIAGEEPELAARLRLAGHKIMRLNHEMTRHDLAMTSIVQWWRRNVRSGHALAQLFHTHGKAPLFLYRKQWRSTVFWTLAVPLVLVVIAVVISPWALGLFPVVYVYLMVRIIRYRLRRGDDRDSAFVYGMFTAVGKFPQLTGMVKFYRNMWAKRPSTLIEYKGASSALPAAGESNPASSPVGNT